MNYCKDCKYFSAFDRCAHPNLGISPVTGKISTQLAALVRSDGRLKESWCGPEGKWFTKKKRFFFL